MKKVEKLLKEGKSKILPSESVRLNLYSELGIYQNEPELTAQAAGGGNATVTKKGQRVTVLAAIALAIIILLSALILLAPSNSNPLGLSYITLDINPAIEIILDENDEVTGVYGINKDGAVLVYGESFTGSKEEVASKVVELFSRCGYFNAYSEMRLYADTTAEKESDFYSALTLAINNKLSQLGVSCAVTTAQSSAEKAKEYGVSAAKYELAEKLSKASGEGIEGLIKLSYDELYKREHNYNESDIQSALNGIQSSSDYAELKTVMRDYESMEDALEDIEKVLKRGGDTVQAIKDYNLRFAKYPDFLIDEALSGNALRNELERLEDLADDMEDEIEDLFDDIKKQYLGYGDDDDDDDD